MELQLSVVPAMRAISTMIRILLAHDYPLAVVTTILASDFGRSIDTSLVLDARYLCKSIQ